jgi:hypothetical protein
MGILGDGQTDGTCFCQRSVCACNPKAIMLSNALLTSRPSTHSLRHYRLTSLKRVMSRDAQEKWTNSFLVLEFGELVDSTISTSPYEKLATSPVAFKYA